MRRWRTGFFLLAAGFDPSLHAHSNDVKIVRDPFWPVGYQHRDSNDVALVDTPVVTNALSPVHAAESAKPDPLVIERMEKELQAKIRAKIQVNGFLKSMGQHLASVNGKIVAVGDKLSVVVDGQTFRFKVKAISPAALNLEPVD